MTGGAARYPALVRTGLLLPAAAAYATALAAVLAPGAALPPALGAGAAAAVAVVIAVRRPSRPVVLVAAGAVVCTAVLAAVALAEPARHPSVVPDGAESSVRLRVDAVTVSAGGTAAGALAVRSIIRGTLVRVDGHVVSSPATLFADGRVAAPSGAVVGARAVLDRAEPADASAWLGRVRGGIRVVEQPGLVAAGADALRTRFARTAAYLPGDGGALLPGLAIGDTSRLRPDLVQAMRDASLSHLTAVSGANCAVVTVAVLALGGLLRLPRLVRIALAGAALAGFVVLVTPQPSVVRAAVMAAVALGCTAIGRRAAGVPALAATVLVLLVADPWIAWSAGFLLSVLATGGLLLLAPPIAARLARVMPRGLAVVLAVPIAAQLACTPVLVLLQPTVPLAGVLANLVTEPAAPLATVLGLLACLVGPVLPPLAGGLALLGWLPACWIALVARSAAGLPALPWPEGVPGLLLAATPLVLGVVVAARAPSARIRLAAGALLVVLLLGIAGAAAGRAVGRLAGVPGDWTFAACDVGQGDGLVLAGGDGRFAVIDTGREPGPILDCLDRLQVRRIDLLVLTHWDADHVGAARAIAGRARTALVGPSDGAAADQLRRDLVAAGVHVVQARRGDRVRLGDLLLAVLWPPDPLGGVDPGNAASIAIRVSGPLSVLLTGDLGAEAQHALLAAGPLGAVDVLKVAHHGSADQSAAFVRAAAARLAVVSVGADNDYGHPTGRLLRLLRASGTAVARTDQDGLVLVGVRGGRLFLWTERPVTEAVWRPAVRGRG